MDQDQQIQAAEKLHKAIHEDLQNVLFALIDTQAAITYFEDDSENPKILVFFNILISKLNQSNQVHKQLNEQAVKLNIVYKLKLIKQHVREICTAIKDDFKLNSSLDEYLQIYQTRILNVDQIEDKKLFNISAKAETEVNNFLKTIPYEKWDYASLISKDEILANLCKRKGKLFIEMQLLWIINSSSENNDYGKPLYLRASYRSDIIFFGVAVVLCIIVAYCMS